MYICICMCVYMYIHVFIYLYNVSSSTCIDSIEFLDSHYPSLLSILSVSLCWLAKQQLYDYLPPISQTIQVRQTRHAEHYWRSKDKLINDALSWTSTHTHQCWQTSKDLCNIYIYPTSPLGQDMTQGHFLSGV